MEAGAAMSRQRRRRYRLACQPLGQGYEGAHRNAAGAFIGVGLAAAKIADSGNIQMRPGRALREFAQDARRADGASLAPDDALAHVGHLALNQFVVILIHWHLPEALATFFAALSDLA